MVCLAHDRPHARQDCQLDPSGGHVMRHVSPVLARIEACGIVAIIRLDGPSPLADVAEALAAGGIEALEFTITTPGALRGVEESAARLGDRALVGVGTVLDGETANAAIAAGAASAVSPTRTPQPTRTASAPAV